MYVYIIIPTAHACMHTILGLCTTGMYFIAAMCTRFKTNFKFEKEEGGRKREEGGKIGEVRERRERERGKER